jgi:acetyl-CoA carboxylase biotin carboxylase subunit
MFQKLLVANRGEIAVRIMRACRELSIPSVAIYSDADRQSMHVRYATEAYYLGPSPAAESYLNVERVIDLARRVGVDAIHPGYGFLAENPTFARACGEAGITFIGPTPEAMERLGDKIAARTLMQQAGVPIVAGTGKIDDPEVAVAAARAIGYPVLVKAAAGGGGRGIRRVDSEDGLRQALAAAAAEALAGFGDGSIYIEKFVSPARHIEVQIIGDDQGNIVALGERECSIQRRHQKMIEECPSAGVDERLRDRLVWAATTAARIAEYRNVGTVEFLVDLDRNYYFLEMNTRLQVEHPVTEIVAGVDLVADQIRVAAGEPLAYTQETVPRRGWAIECRIVAEDPRQNFIPSVGTIAFAREPAGPGVRVESALYDGFEVSIYYDALVAKVTAWGRNRDEAIRRMRRALSEFKIVGVETNLQFHVQVMDNPYFRAGQIDTDFLEKHFDPNYEPPQEGEDAALIAAALLSHLRMSGARVNGVEAGSDTNGVGATVNPWRSMARPGRVGGAGWRGSWR